MTDRSILAPPSPPQWQLTLPLPAGINDAIEAEHEPVRQQLVDVVRRIPPTSINLTAILFALADTAAYVALHGEAQQNQLTVKPANQLGLAESFVGQFRHQLKRQRTMPRWR